MAVCVKIKGKKKVLCVGDLNKKIKLEARSLTAPKSGSVDLTETFIKILEPWAMVETVSGSELFNGSSTIKQFTHRFYIRYVSNVTFETWIEMDDIKYDILDVENIDESNEWLKIRANKQGSDTNSSNFA